MVVLFGSWMDWNGCFERFTWRGGPLISYLSRPFCISWRAVQLGVLELIRVSYSSGFWFRLILTVTLTTFSASHLVLLG